MIEINQGPDGKSCRGTACFALELSEQLAEKIRHEPYRLFTYNCYHKSWKFLKEASKKGINAKMSPVIGIARARLPFLGWRVIIPALHCWVEVEGKRIEVSRPLGHKSVWDIMPAEVKPVLAVRFNPFKCSDRRR